jgi:hypothetical protein
MCGRYRLSRPDKLAGRFDIEPEDDRSVAPDIFDYVSTIDHTLASAIGSFETAGTVSGASGR